MPDGANRVIVITGATGNLGPVVAGRFAAGGDRVVILGRSEDSCVAVIMRLPGRFDRHGFEIVDLDDPDDVAATAARVRERFGGATVLLHLVGGYAGGTPVEATAVETWRSQVDLNLMTAVHTIRAFLPDIRAADNGRIVTVSTPLAGAPVTNASAYAATKAAVESLTLTVARELAATTATANCVLVRMIGGEKPTATRPEEIAAAIWWLCSPDAGAVNGQRIPVLGRA